MHNHTVILTNTGDPPVVSPVAQHHDRFVAAALNLNPMSPQLIAVSIVSPSSRLTGRRENTGMTLV